MKLFKGPTWSFLKISWKVNPLYFLAIFLASIFSAFTLLFNTYSMKLIFDTVIDKDFDSSIMVAYFVILMNLFLNFTNRFIKMWREQESLRSTYKFRNYLGNQLANVPYYKLEDENYLDLVEQGKQIIFNQGVVERFLNSMSTIISSALSIITLITVMFTLSYIIFLVLILYVFLRLLVFIKSTKYLMSFYESLTPINRKYGYYNDTIRDVSNGKDFRLYSTGRMILKNFKKYGNTVLDGFASMYKNIITFNCIEQVLTALHTAWIYFFIAFKTISDHLSVGDFSFYASAALSLTSSISTITSDIVNFRSYASYMSIVLKLIDSSKNDDEKKEVFTDKIHSVEFEDVSFTYPNTDAEILTHLSFKIMDKERISLVGLNGSGKTTIAKLLSGLYNPTSGRILINGVDLNLLKNKDYCQEVSVVFQDFKLFSFPIDFNVMGNDDEADVALKYLTDVGLLHKIETLPKGVKSVCSKEFDPDGILFSGGEEQKIAIAQALAKDSSFIILDEPTSALDPLSEAEIYERFHQLVKEKMALYISHRLSSTIFADRILVLSHGQIIEAGTHIELMKNKEGLYQKLFSLQAKNYQLHENE